eukprot:3893111-Heterocapsa_arctica.AAC.1
MFVFRGRGAQEANIVVKQLQRQQQLCGSIGEERNILELGTMRDTRWSKRYDSTSLRQDGLGPHFAAADSSQRYPYEYGVFFTWQLFAPP